MILIHLFKTGENDRTRTQRILLYININLLINPERKKKTELSTFN